MEGLAVELAGHVSFVHLNLDVIPAVVLNPSGCSSEGRLGPCHTVLYAMLSVVPSAEVPPGVVVGILIVEQDEETLIAAVLSRAYLIYISAFGRDIEHGGTVFGRPRLGEDSIRYAPVADAECPLAVGCGKVVGGNPIALQVGEHHVVIADLRVPGAHTHLALSTFGNRVARFGPEQVLLAEMVGHELLYIVGRGDEVGTRIEMNHIIGPAGVALVHEDGSERSHAAHVAVAFHAEHIDGFSQCTVHVAIAAIGASCISGILSVVDADGAWIAIIFVIVVAHPGVAAVVVFIHQFHGIVVAPGGVVGSPGFHVADGDDLRIFLLDGLVEHIVAFRILFALLTATCLIVLIAYLDEFQVVRFGVSVGDTLGSPNGRGIAVGIFDGIECILHQCFCFFQSKSKTMTQSHVHDEKRCGSEVFTQLEILVKAETVGRAVVPVLVEMSRALFNGSDGLLPLERIVITAFPLHIASAGETEERRFGIGEQLRQVGPQAVGAVLPGIREERHHIEGQLTRIG